MQNPGGGVVETNTIQKGTVKTMDKRRSDDPQYEARLKMYEEKGLVQFGLVTSLGWRTDPRHLLFVFARYKFCARMLAGKDMVLEVGCGDGFCVPLLLPAVKWVHGIDIEPAAIQDANARLATEDIDGCSFEVFDITERQLPRKFDAAYSLDVLEHISPEAEERFMTNICKSLHSHGIFITGTPNIEARKHASYLSEVGHINLKSADSLRELMLSYFHNVLIFSMNDEVVHTGFYPMAHYLLAVGVGIKA